MNFYYCKKKYELCIETTSAIKDHTKRGSDKVAESGGSAVPGPVALACSRAVPEHRRGHREAPEADASSQRASRESNHLVRQEAENIKLRSKLQH